MNKEQTNQIISILAQILILANEGTKLTKIEEDFDLYSYFAQVYNKGEKLEQILTIKELV